MDAFLVLLAVVAAWAIAGTIVDMVRDGYRSRPIDLEKIPPEKIDAERTDTEKIDAEKIEQGRVEHSHAARALATRQYS